jgi:4-aminobutyrate aminotransferase-like enzyme
LAALIGVNRRKKIEETKMNRPVDNDLCDDPRVAEARRLIREAVSEHRGQISGLRPADEGKQLAFSELLAKLAELRGGGLYYPYLGSGIGNGSLVELVDGSVKYDMITGIGVHVAGHSNVDLIDALVQASISDTVMQGNLQQNVDSLRLCDRLIQSARESGSELAHCFLSTSGATANENAIKMLFQARYPADRLLAFSNCFAGRTMALAQLTDRPGNRDGLPATIDVDYVPFFDANDPQSVSHSLAVLSEHLRRYPKRHAGMCLELIQGEGGYYAAPREFFIALIECLREHEIPTLFDEVQTFGRTTRLFAFQHLELDAYTDIVTIGKMSQVCATLFTDQYKSRPGLVSQTFTGSTASIHAANYILGQLEDSGQLGPDGRTTVIHERFAGHFQSLHDAHPDWISGPWGIGGMVAFTAMDGSVEKTKRFLNELYTAGVIAFPAGANPTRVRMLPPLLAVQDDDIDNVCQIITQTLERTAEMN